MGRQLYAGEDFGVEIKNTAYALDTRTIDLSLSLFLWAYFRRTKAAGKLHTLFDLQGNIPTFIHISDGKLHEVNGLDQIAFEAESFYVMYQGFLDFGRLHALHQAQAFFVIRAKSNLQYQRLYSHSIDKASGLRHVQTVVHGLPTTASPRHVLRRQVRLAPGTSPQPLRSASTAHH